MPGHFTHIYTARRVADLLADPQTTSFDLAGTSLGAAAGGRSPSECADLMKKWERFTAVGAVGPDLFFFCQDYSSGPLAAAPFQDDVLMLALAVWYWVDAAKEDDYEPLLVLLAEVNGTFAEIVRLLIKLKKLWDEFVKVWKATIGPFVDAAAAVLDDLTGGLVEEFTTALSNLAAALQELAEQELVSFADVFSWFSLKMRMGWDEQAFVWSDMLHYRRTSQMAANLLAEAERQHQAGASDEQHEQFLAYILGWVCHIGTDVVAHAFVNEQCGGPFRTHYQRHHLVENHMDAHNYREAGPGGSLPTDPMAATATYPDVDGSALVFSVALDDEHPEGWQRPADLPDDPDARKAALDVDGQLPDWLADGIVRALVATYHDKGLPEPANLGGGPFQAGIGASHGAVQDLLDAAGIDIDRPLSELIDMIAPTPDFEVPPGYPLPWEVKFCYRFMISFYKLSFSQGFDLRKPKVPDIIIWPPASDLSDLASTPDFSGASSGDPVQDVCSALKSLFDWLLKEVEAAIKLAGDLVKMLASPFTYGARAGLHELAMIGWNIATNAHEILAHTGFVYPHGERRYPDGELAVPNEIDLPLITLGKTLDSAFTQALADAIDPFGNLDLGTDELGSDHDPQQPFPWLPVREVQDAAHKPNEFRRPWAHPGLSRRADGSLVPTPLEPWDVDAELDRLGLGQAKEAVHRALGKELGLTVPGPYQAGTMPEEMLRTANRGDATSRLQYEAAFTPVQTDLLNTTLLIQQREQHHNPLGDPVPFSAYLIGQILSEGGYPVDFNLDADRGYAYLCWDWNRSDRTGKNARGQGYSLPDVAPEGSTTGDGGDDWPGAPPDHTQVPLRLHYLERKRPQVPAGGGDSPFGPATHGPLGPDGPDPAGGPR